MKSTLLCRDLPGPWGQDQRPPRSCPPAPLFLTVCGAAAGPVAGTVPHLDSLPSHFQQVWVGQAGFAGVPESLLVVATVVGDVDRRPGRPGRGLLQLRTRIGVTGLVFLGEKAHSVSHPLHRQSPVRRAVLLQGKVSLLKTSDLKTLTAALQN